MTLIELVESVAQSTGKTKKEVKEVLQKAFSTISETAIKGEEVKLPGFGKFAQRVLKPRMVVGNMSKGRTTIKFRSYQ